MSKPALLQGGQRRDVGFLPEPCDIWMTADRTRRGAGRIDQDAVEAAAAGALPFDGIGDDGFGRQCQPRQIVLQPRDACGRTVERDHARAGMRELRGLAAGRGT